MAKVDKMKRGNNQGKKEDIAKTIEEISTAPKAKPVVLTPSSIQSAFHSAQNTQAIDYVLAPGKTMEDFGLRADIPPSNDEAVVRGTSLAILYAKARQRNCLYIMNVIQLSMEFWAARDGKRMDKAIEAITGARPNENMRRGRMDLRSKVKQWAGLEKKEEPEEDR